MLSAVNAPLSHAMPLSKVHKARTRERILAAAAVRFRAQGFRGAAVDDIMRDAGLTRGGFYAHFSSKAALFAEVLASRHDLHRRLAARPAARDALKGSGRAVLHAYVDPANASVVGPGCTMANLAAEAGRGGPRTRRIFAAATERLVAEILRGEGGSRRSEVLAALAMAVGAVGLARACRGAPIADELLGATHAHLDRVLDTRAVTLPRRVLRVTSRRIRR